MRGDSILEHQIAAERCGLSRPHTGNADATRDLYLARGLQNGTGNGPWQRRLLRLQRREAGSGLRRSRTRIPALSTALRSAAHRARPIYGRGDEQHVRPKVVWGIRGLRSVWTATRLV